MNPLFERLPEAAAAAILALPAAVHAIVANLDIATPEWVGSLTQVSAFGLVAWIVFFMFRNWLPAIQAANAQQLKEQREDHTSSMQAMASAHAQAITTLANTFSESLKTQRSDLLALANHAHALKNS